MKILVLKEDVIKKVFSMEDAIEADKEAMKIYSSGKSLVPLRINIDIPEKKGQSLYMPGYAAEANALGVKIISVYPNNVKKGLNSVPSTMVLMDDETGEVCSIIDGTYLTRIRTGALSGAASQLLSRKDSSVFALIGTGGQAESQLEAVLTVRNIKEVRIFSRNLEHAKYFADEMYKKFKDEFKVKFVVAASSDEAIDNADIITSVTTALLPTFDGRLVKKGAHINGVGSYTPIMQEVDEYTVLNADKIYVDTREGVLKESGDFIIPINKNKCGADIVTGELGEVLLGNVKAREKDEEITFFKSVGSGVFDIVTAKRIYEKAARSGLGTIIEF